MKAVGITLAVLILAFIAIQFVPSGMPDISPDDESSLTSDPLMAGKVIDLLKNSCYDCHSNQTNFPWYSKIAPSSWILADHINDGKSHLNFSEWGKYSKREKIGLLDDIKEEVESGEMPLKSYLWLHRDAKLDENEVIIISDWVEEATAKILE